jgi:hypothetical protein
VQSKKHKDGIREADDLVKCFSLGLIPSGLTLLVFKAQRAKQKAQRWNPRSG